MIVSHGAFGIEFEWLTAEGSEQALGYHFQVGGRTLGNVGIEQSVLSAQADVTQLLRHEGNRRHDAWQTKPPELVLGELEAALLVDFDPAIDPGPHWQAHLRFSALPAQSAVFRGWSGFLIETADEARLVWAKQERRAPVLEQRLALGDFEATLKEFRAALEQRCSVRQSAPPTSGERVVSGVSGRRAV